MALTEDVEIVRAAISVLASVSAANLANRGELLPRTLVNPYALRELADEVERRYPGIVDQTRNALPD